MRVSLSLSRYSARDVKVQNSVRYKAPTKVAKKSSPLMLPDAGGASGFTRAG